MNRYFGKHTGEIRKNSILLKKYMWNYIFILPGIVALFIFSYMPMVGAQIAFRDYQLHLGIWKSPWVGFDNFWFFNDSYFWASVKNTIIITIYRFAVSFPAPIIMALLINEVRNIRVKRIIQSTTYLPHFISWIVVAYMYTTMLAIDTGIINSILQNFGFEQIFFMGEPKYFRSIVVLTGVWKSAGWGSIIYLAALSGIDPNLHEAAIIDGAGRISRIRYINIPGIMPTIVIILILQMPSFLHAGYEQILPFVNPVNLEISNVLDVYIIDLGLNQGRFSLSASIGLAMAIISLILIIASNYFAKKINNIGLW
jgi:putative aldouronate transport system permease protein